MQNAAASPPTPLGAASRLPALCLTVALTLLALAVRSHLVGRFGVNVPYMDQWDGELETLYFKYLDHTLKLADFFRPANEHRIVYTRLLNLGLFIAGREQFDSLRIMRWQAAVSVVPLAVVLWSLNRRRLYVLPSLCVALLMMLPLSWENLFWAYQSQVYFALIFATLGLSFAARPDVPLGRIACCVALGAASMGSAMFTAACAACVCGWQAIAQRRWAWLARAALFLALTYAASLVIWHNPGHRVLRATTWKQFADTLWMYAVWPARPFAGAGLLAWGGCAAAAGHALWRRRALAPPQRLGLLLALWSAMAAVAASYSRSGMIANRYFDYIVLAYVGAALVVAPFAEAEAAAVRAATAVYLAALALPLLCMNVETTLEAAGVAGQRRAMVEQVGRALVAGADGPEAAYGVLQRSPAQAYPDDRRLSELLADPRARHALRALVPAP